MSKLKKWKIICEKKSDYLKIADAMYDDNFTYIQKGPKKPIKFLGEESVVKEVKQLINKLNIECVILDIEEEKEMKKKAGIKQEDSLSSDKKIFDTHDTDIDLFPNIPSLEEYGDLPYAFRDDFSSWEEEIVYKIRNKEQLSEKEISSIINGGYEIHRDTSQVDNIFQIYRRIHSIVQLENATFAIEWEECLADTNKDRFNIQPYEVEQVKQWVRVKSEKTDYINEEEAERE